LPPALRRLQEKRGSAMKWSSPMFLAIGLVIGLSMGLMLTPLIASENDVKIAPWLEVVHRVCTSVGGLAAKHGPLFQQSVCAGILEHGCGALRQEFSDLRQRSCCQHRFQIGVS